MSEPLDRLAFKEILKAVLQAHDIDPAGAGSVPLEKIPTASPRINCMTA